MGRVCGLRTATWFSHSSAIKTATIKRSFEISSGSPPGVFNVRLSSSTPNWPAPHQHQLAHPSRAPQQRTVFLGIHRDRLPEPPHHLLGPCDARESALRTRGGGRGNELDVCGSAGLARWGGKTEVVATLLASAMRGIDLTIGPRNMLIGTTVVVLARGGLRDFLQPSLEKRQRQPTPSAPLPGYP
jgi:hypothetical protein